MKVCTGCGIEKGFGEFHKRSASVDGLNARCKVCMKLADAKRYQNNTEARAERNKIYRTKNSEVLKIKKKFYQKNRPQAIRDAENARKREWRKANSARVREWHERYHERKPHLRSAFNAKYKAAKLQATPVWANFKAIEEFYAAADFLSMVTGEWYEVDHIVPIRSKLVCGLHCEANLQILTLEANRSKSNRFWPDMPGIPF